MGVREVETVIIGAGLGGIAAALALADRGRTDVVLLERGDGPGGVWRANTYPGAACDVPSPYYSFAAFPRLDWPRRYSTQPDILDYIHRVVDRAGLAEKIVTGAEVTAAVYDEGAARWTVRCANGDEYRARFLIPAVGQLSEPAPITVPGAGRFTGTAFHTARWDHTVEMSGRRIAVVGTGASAVQVVAALADQAGSLRVFQRSPAHLLPRLDQAYGPRLHRLFARFPWLVRAERGFWWAFAELWTLAVLGNPVVDRLFRTWSWLQRRIQIRDPELRVALTPTHPMGCKRVLFSSDYYPALQRENVRLITDPIDAVTETGIRTVDGTEHEVDVIVYATGFDTQHFCDRIDIRGRGGRALAAQWQGGARAYLGIAVPGFPNMGLMYGPNTNLGTGSILYMMERQARYIAEAIDRLDRAGLTAAEVREEVEQAYDVQIQRELAGTAWARCDSWYRTAGGRITSNWPRTVSAYDRALAAVDPADYRPVA